MKAHHLLLILFCSVLAGGILTGCGAGQQLTAHAPLDEPAHLTSSGDTLLARGDLAGARGYFERALGMTPDYVPALAGLAKVAAKEGNQKRAFVQARHALSQSRSAQEKELATATIMRLWLEGKPENWLAEMEESWQQLRSEVARPEEATLLMGRGYQLAGQSLKASVCYRQVLAWGGNHVQAADKRLQELFQQLRAESGTAASKGVAPLEVMSRGDLAALLIEDLKLSRYIAARTSKKYQSGFQSPVTFHVAAPAAQLPADVMSHPYQVDIADVLSYGIRGLEVFPDGNFHPDEPVNRANFALAVEDVLARVKEEPQSRHAFLGNDSPFPDVASDHYAFNAIVVTTTRNFLAADLDGAFRPTESVSGAEVLLAMRRLREEIKSHQVRY